MATFAVIGLEHLHVFELTQGLLDAGARLGGFSGDPGPLFDLYATTYGASLQTSADKILTDPSVALVVLAGIPNERAAVAVAALGAGKSVLSDKPGVTTPDQLDAVLAAERATPQRWWVLFSERFTNRAINEAIRRTHAGEIGRVVDVLGLGPHSLFADRRPAWFWNPEQSGGILADIGSHQIDQFCAIVAPDNAAVDVVDASTANVSCPDHPRMQDLGRMSLRCGDIIGTHRVDYLSPAGLGTWGDCRLMITGTEGTLEVRANVDLAGAAGAEHLIKVDAHGTERIDCSAVAIDWARRLLADLASLDGPTPTDSLMSTAATAQVCRLALGAQQRGDGPP